MKSVTIYREKPPIGIMPEYIWKLQRKRALADAMWRYLSAGIAFPIAWLEEYNKLIEQLEVIGKIYDKE